MGFYYGRALWGRHDVKEAAIEASCHSLPVSVLQAWGTLRLLPGRRSILPWVRPRRQRSHISLRIPSNN